MNKISLQEVVELFPDELPTVKRLIGSKQREILRLKISRYSQIQALKKLGLTDELEFVKQSIIEIKSDLQIKLLASDIKRLRTLHKIYKGDFTDHEDEIRNAHATPITTLLSHLGVKHRKSGNNYIARCPLHEERTPSFFVYEEDNRWRCFGCSESGDGIELVKRILDYSFIRAVEYINTLKNENSR